MSAIKVFTGCVAAAAMFAAACSSNDEHLAEKDRQITELRDEGKSLRDELQQSKNVQQLTQQQLEDQKRLAANASAAQQPPALKTDVESPVNAGGDRGAKKPVVRHAAVRDVHVDSEERSDGSFMYRLKGAATFAPGSDQLTKDGREALDKIAAELKKTKGAIVVEGHTDASPLTGKNKETYGDNLNLSIARAVSVRTRLVEQGRIAADRITVSGRGDTTPLAKGATKDAYARNRRVEIVVKDD